MCQGKMRFFFLRRDIWTTKWVVCVCGTRGSFFLPNHKMNHEAAEEFHSLRVCSSIRDLEDYWSQSGTATALPPRGSANKTQLLGKIIARRHQNISNHASTLPALRGFYLPPSCKSPLKETVSSSGTEQRRNHNLSPKPAPLPCFPPQHYLPSSCPSQKPGSHS